MYGVVAHAVITVHDISMHGLKEVVKNWPFWSCLALYYGAFGI